MLNITDRNALLLAEALGPNVPIYLRDNSIDEHRAIDREEARRLIEEGKGKNVFVQLGEGGIATIIEKLSEYQDAFSQVANATNLLQEKMLSTRAVYVREAATRIFCKLLENGALRPEKDLCAMAITMAEGLDAAIWEKFGDSLSLEVE